MKKIPLLLVLVMLVCGFLKAQDFKMGLRIGPNFSTLYDVKSEGMYTPSLFSGKQNYKMSVGVRAGIIFDIGFTDVISLQPALYYSLQRYGSKGEFTMTDPTSLILEGTTVVKTEEDYRTQLIQIPVLVNFKIHFANNFRHAFVLGVGPYFSVAVSGRDIVTGTATDSEGNIYDIESRQNYYKSERIYYTVRNRADGTGEQYLAFVSERPFKQCDFGFTFAAGFELNKFYVGAACDLGVINSANVKTWEDAGIKGYTQRNLNLQITIGYTFN